MIFFTGFAHAQNLKISSGKGLNLDWYTDRNLTVNQISGNIPLFSFRVNGNIFNMGDAISQIADTSFVFSFENQISGEVFPDQHFNKGWKCRIIIRNNTGDTVDIENIVPFGETAGHIYLTSTGPWALARAKIFRPGLGPVGVILPDNAWELGYGAIPLHIRSSMGQCKEIH